MAEPMRDSRRAIELLRAGRLPEAEATAREVLAAVPNDAAALHCLGVIAQKTGRHPEAAALIERAIAVDPEVADYHFNLSVSHTATGRNDAAIAELRQVIRLRPGQASAHENLGVLLFGRGRLDEAEAAVRQAIALEPRNPWSWLNLGKIVRASERLDEAEASFRRAIEIDPRHAHAWNMLGSCLRELGRIDEALDALRRAIALKPDLRTAHSNLCYDMHFDPHATPRDILNETVAWDRKFAEPLRRLIRSHEDHDRDPSAGSGGRRLRLGFVSADFRQHVVGQNILPMFRAHDHSRFEIFCYSNAPVPDVMTEEFRGYADSWRDIRSLSDDQAADLVRADRIDILVDLTLHMADNRLLVFARKPAPVQATFAGYPSTTGLATIDYRLTDLHMDPPGKYDADYRETPVAFSGCFWCYAPLGRQPPLNALPALSNGFVTFGCSNTFAKVNGPTIELWARVLRAVPTARMLILAPRGSARQRAREAFRGHGVDPERISFADRRRQFEYLELYHEFDVNLDPQPYPGHTTTMDSLWMGVPVVNLPGATAVSRGGRSILTAAGVPELVAKSPEEYVRIATELAGDLPRLTRLRATLRERMQTSPLMDSTAFARNIEAAYCRMWRQWATGAA